MSRITRPTSVLVALCLAASAAWAQDAPSTPQELHELRVLVEKQSKQIDALTEQVARMNHALAANPLTPAPIAPPTPTLVAPAASPLPAVPASAPAATPAPGEFAPDAPKAEAEPGQRHVVVKGETLTSIAKHYNITLADLQKANKDVNDRKLQIGQTLNIPTTKTPDTTEKKENP